MKPWTWSWILAFPWLGGLGIVTVARRWFLVIVTDLRRATKAVGFLEINRIHALFQPPNPALHSRCACLPKLDDRVWKGTFAWVLTKTHMTLTANRLLLISLNCDLGPIENQILFVSIFPTHAKNGSSTPTHKKHVPKCSEQFRACLMSRFGSSAQLFFTAVILDLGESLVSWDISPKESS